MFIYALLLCPLHLALIKSYNTVTPSEGLIVMLLLEENRLAGSDVDAAFTSVMLPVVPMLEIKRSWLFVGTAGARSPFIR